jgi:hypothetical protein
MPVSNEIAHIIDFLRKTYNVEVRAWFKDLSNELEEGKLPDNATGRKSAMRACLITPKDTMTSIDVKMSIFRYVVQKTHLRPEIFTVLKSENRVNRKGKPQIILYFKQDLKDVSLKNGVPEYRPVEGEISFRLMDKDINDFRTYPNALVTKYGNEIKSKFITGGGYLWTRGKSLWSYTELSRGYQFQIIASSKAEAENLIKATMAIQDHVPNWSYLNIVKAENEAEAFPTIPDKEKVFGETVTEPTRRKPVTLRFQYATLYVPPAKPRNLIDRTGRRINPLVEL